MSTDPPHLQVPDEIINCITQLLPTGRSELRDPRILKRLTSLTADLIQAYGINRLRHDPFAEVYARDRALNELNICNYLKGKVVLVTGGEGFVGRHLIRKLNDCMPRRLISVDIAAGNYASRLHASVVPGMHMARYTVDVRDDESLGRVFALESPDIIFHLAGQRQPGLAERQVRQTVTSNILGTQNIIRLCERYLVETCIFSSTGKASRYFTREVYAGSKKVAEWQMAVAAQEGHTTYGMVRFTHVLENSLVREEIAQHIRRGLVSLHAPYRYIYGQTVSEAVHLLLNALVLSTHGRLKLLVMRDLGWPIHILELALHMMVTSGQAIPVCFSGTPPGYNEPLFEGHYDWRQKREVNALVNALEAPLSTTDASGKILIADLAPFSTAVLRQSLVRLQNITGNLAVSEDHIKEALSEIGREMARSFFGQARPAMLLNILKWGVRQQQTQDEKADLGVHQDIIQLLVHALYGRLNEDMWAEIDSRSPCLDELVKMLVTIPLPDDEVNYLRCITERLSENMPWPSSRFCRE
jgi:FlaA1/EpsC-like NDP-sugar epimerase